MKAKVRIERNEALGGVELYFDTKPESKVIDALKSANFRWHRAKQCWYNKLNEKSEAMVAQLAGGIIPEPLEVEPVKIGAVAEPSFNYTGYGFEGVNYKEYGHDIVTIAKTIKKELLRLYPGSVWSVSTSKYSGGQHLTITLLASPYPAYRDLDELKADMDAFQKAGRRVNQYSTEVGGWEDAVNKELESIIYYFNKSGQAQVNQYHIQEDAFFTPEVRAMMITAKNLANSFNYDDSDSMIDYFSVNFYYTLEIGAYNKPYTVKEAA